MGYVAHNNNEGGRYLMVTDKPLRPRSCTGPIEAGVHIHTYMGGADASIRL